VAHRRQPAAVREALNEHKALVFRGVDLDDEGQQRFAGYFGPVTAAHPTVPAVDGKPNVLPVDSYDGPVNCPTRCVPSPTRCGRCTPTTTTT
jgi:alkyl sulfatase